MICSGCESVNQDGAKFCGECGAALALRCAACGITYVMGQRFCHECGAALGSGAVAWRRAESPPAARVPPLSSAPADAVSDVAGSSAGDTSSVAEMRLVSVLFVDLVGFTTLSESRDPEDVRDLLGRYFAEARAVVARHGGQIEKFIGDAVMAVWGAPVAREDDAERAVRAALEIVEAVAGLRGEVDAPGLAARAGVVTGRAAALERSDEGIVVGDRVNTAARVQAAAPPGGVLVDAVTRQATASAVVYADGGEHALKGITRPLQLWRAVEVVSSSGQAEAEQGIAAPFIGRDGELRIVVEQLERTLERRAARLVAVSGEAGLGKSRLRREFGRYGDSLSETVLWHTGRCLSYGEGVAFSALEEMVRQRLGIPEQAAVDEAKVKLAAGLERWVPEERDRALVEPALGALLGASNPGLGRAELFAGWRLFFESLAAHEPVVLVFEDVQWADAGLLEFIELILDWSSEVPIFMLALTRPQMTSGPAGWPSGRRAATLVTLDPLAEPEMRALLAGMVDLPEAAAEQIIARATGVPLYVTETVRALASRGVLTDRGGRLALDGELGELDVPASLGALLSARLDGLTTQERELAKAMSVFRGAFPRSAAAALGGDGQDSVDDTLSALVRSGVFAIRADPLSPDRGQYTFAQQLTRDVTYDLLSRRERKARHLAAVVHLRRSMPNDGEDVAEVIAAHMRDAYHAAGRDPDATELAGETVIWLRRAAQRALQVDTPNTAERLYRTAVDLTSEEPERAELTYLAGHAAMRTGRHTDAETLLETAAAAHAAAGRIPELALTTMRLGAALTRLGRPRAAAERGEAVLTQLVGLAGCGVIRAVLSSSMAVDYAVMGEVSRAERLIDGALPTIVAEYRRAMGPLDVHTETLLADFALPAIELDPEPVSAELFDIKRELTLALDYAANVCVIGGRPERARARFNAAIMLAERHGLIQLAGGSHANAGNLAWQWDLPEAMDEFAAAISAARRVGDRALEAFAAGNLVVVGLLRGRIDEIESHRAKAPSEADEAGLARALAFAHAQRGELEPARIALARNGAVAADHLETYALHMAAETAIALAAGELDHAVDLGLAILPRTVAALTPATDGVRLGWPPAFEAAIDTGRIDDARSLLTLLADQPAERLPPFLGAQLARGRGLLAAAQDATGDAETHLRAATTQFAALQYPYWLAVTQAELAQVLDATGPAPEATTLRDEATAALYTLKAAPALARIQTRVRFEAASAASRVARRDG